MHRDIIWSDPVARHGTYPNYWDIVVVQFYTSVQGIPGYGTITGTNQLLGHLNSLAFYHPLVCQKQKTNKNKNKKKQQTNKKQQKKNKLLDKWQTV